MAEDDTAKLQAILDQYEVSIADANDLVILYDYEIVVIADDSGSMRSPAPPPGQRRPGQRPPTRWQELQDTLGLIVELGNCFDDSGLDLYFLNRPKLPNVKSAYDPVMAKAFEAPPNGSTPLTETVRTLARDVSGEKPVLLFILTDGEPDGGAPAFCQALDDLVNKRSTRTTFKVQIMACTGDDDAVGYLDALDKNLAALDCTEDYYTEKEQVIRSGKTQKFTRGDWCLKAMLGPVSHKFDQWDERAGGNRPVQAAAPSPAPAPAPYGAPPCGASPYGAPPYGAAPPFGAPPHAVAGAGYPGAPVHGAPPYAGGAMPGMPGAMPGAFPGKHHGLSGEGAKPELNDVTIEVLEAESLKASDTGMFESGKSDPYCVVKDVKGLRGDDKKTFAADKTLNPVWNETFNYQFNYKLSSFKFKLWDDDRWSRDDPLGSCELPIHAFYGNAVVGKPATVDCWLPVKKGTGKLHVRVTVRFNITVAIPLTKIPLPPVFQIGLAWDFSKKKTPIDLDASIIGFDAQERIVDQVWYRKLQGFGGAVRHSGDDRSGKGDGDDEVITIDGSRVPGSVEKFAVVINSYTGQSLSEVKCAYVRVIVNGRTHAFYTLGKGRIPNCTGMFFGAIHRGPSGWDFVTTAAPANGRTVQDSAGAVVAFGKQYLSW